MNRVRRHPLFLTWVCAMLLQGSSTCIAQSAEGTTPPVAAPVALTPEARVWRLNDSPHAKSIDFAEASVLDHELGLGAIKKVRGVWQFKRSERVSGKLQSYTWQIIDGFSSAEVMEELLDSFVEAGGAQLDFACDGRACGQSSQWANRVFGQRILYGSEDKQHYRVYTLAGDTTYRLIVYSAYRSDDRQYLRVDLLRTGG